MSSQKFSSAQREALWFAHKKKCAYTGELLDVNHFHIDHVIPENIANDTAEFERLRKEFGLTKEFDIFGYSNLLPCHPSVNLQKGQLLLSRVNYFLSIAASKVTELEASLKQIENRQNRGKTLILLQQCLDSGELTHAEVAKILEDYKEQPEEIFHLIEKMAFCDATEIRAIAKSDIEALRCKPVKLGKNEHLTGVTMGNRTSGQLIVQTCEEYDRAISAGYCPLTNVDIKASSFFRHQCGLLTSLKRATIPKISFVNEPRIGIVDLEFLPFIMFPYLGRENKETAKCYTYQDKVTDGTIVVKRLSQNMLCVEEQDGMGQYIVEAVRADFNGDGTEDILLFEYCYHTIGSMGYGGITILTRKSETGLFEVIKCL